QQTPEIESLQVELWLTQSDLLVLLGDIPKALDLAQTSESLARKHVEMTGSSDLGWRRLVYESAFRVGDITSDITSAESKAGALSQYRSAQQIALQLATRPTGNFDARAAVIFATNKVAEMLHSLGRSSEALAELDTALNKAEMIANEKPDNLYRRRLAAIVHASIGKILAEQSPPDFERAGAQYAAAFTTLDLVLARNRDSEVISNLAYFHRGNGAVFEARRDLDKAMEEYRV